MDLITVNIIISSLTLLTQLTQSFIKHLRKSKCCSVIEVDMKSSQQINTSEDKTNMKSNNLDI